MAPFRWLAELVQFRTTRTVPALVIGLVGVLLISAVLGPNDSAIARTIEALLLVVPVVAAAVLGGRGPAYLVAGVAAILFTLLVPPVGSPRIEVAADLVALIVFTVVAFAVSTLVAARINALGRVEGQRRMLLRSVSHELRTPLAAITAASSELLEGADHDRATRRRLLTLVGEESQRLDRIVANLLSLSRIEAGALVPNRQPTEVGELVEATLSRLDRALGSCEVVVDVEPDLPAVPLDFLLMDQVLGNLLENAARHSPAGGRIELRASSVRDSVEIEVSDSGPGVAPEEAKVIFEPFHSGDVPGIGGIGLTICRSVVEAHGGTISVRDASGGGARFAVTLPLPSG
jgi:K+-sensing histidine kinase KdpD